jgi:SPP1 gp7 family putative phage head morphogenesis protein
MAKRKLTRAERFKFHLALSASRRAELGYVRDLKRVAKAIHKAAMDVVLRDLKPQWRADVSKTNHGLGDHFTASMFRYVKKQVRPAFDEMAHLVDASSSKGMALVGITPKAAGIADILARVRDENIRLVEDAMRDYADSVRDIFDDPDNLGRRVEDVSDELEKRGDVSESRAALIGRDQTLKLNASLNEARQTAVGIDRYTWSTSLDERVRPYHSDLEGAAIDWDDPPVTDKKGNRNHAGMDFQCRCIAIPIIGEFEEAPPEPDIPDLDYPDLAAQ